MTHASVSLLNADLFRFRLLRLDLGNVHGENAVLALAADRLGVHILRQTEAALEGAVEALDAMKLLGLVLLLLLALALDGDHPAIHGDLDVLLLHSRQRGADHILLVRLTDIRRGRPFDLVAVAGQLLPSWKASRHQSVEEPVHICKRIPSYQAHTILLWL